MKREIHSINRTCIECNEKANQFRNEQSKKDYEITKLCQTCQDKTYLNSVFGAVTSNACMRCKRDIDYDVIQSKLYSSSGVCQDCLDMIQKDSFSILEKAHLDDERLADFNLEKEAILNAIQITYQKQRAILIKTSYCNLYPCLIIIYNDGNEYERLNKNLSNPEIKYRIAIRDDYDVAIINDLISQNLISPINKKVQYGYIYANIFDLLF